jgi:hypothetical protein
MQLIDNQLEVRRLVNEAEDDTDFQRRNEVRHPFFRPVKIITSECVEISALSRNISETGIGLIHHSYLQATTVWLVITRRSGEQMKVAARIRWCRPIGDQWFISGGEFLAAGAQTSI